MQFYYLRQILRIVTFEIGINSIHIAQTSHYILPVILLLLLIIIIEFL